jgi:hypothetical protein
MRTPSWIRILSIAIEGLALGSFLMACSGGGGSDFAALDSSVSGDKIPCSIKEKIPSTQTVKVSSIIGTTTSFNVTPSTSSCQIFFFVNGTKVNTDSASLVGIDSNTLLAGTNTIRVEASNDLGRDYFEWTVNKNTAPTCAKVSPAAGSINMINTATQLFTASGAADAGESLRFRWLLDGQVNAAVGETISGATASQGSFTANSSLNGTRTISAEVSDGLDSVTCSWTVAVGDDCSVTAKAPDLASVRLAAVGGSGSYSVTTTTTSCLVVWALNGVELSGTTASRTITSTDLNTGSNLLKAEVTSSSGNTSKSWTLVKNSPPTCNQSPAATGTQASVGNPLGLTANIIDLNSDVVTWNWFLNGVPVVNPPVSVTNGSNTTTATFTPAVGNIGYNSFLLTLSDGYDTATCPWNIQVNPSCSVLGSSPVSGTVTVPSLGSTVNTFNITPSDATCIVAWSLNGINLGNSLSMLNILSSNLTASGTLTASVSNSSSSGTTSWTVVKNTPPVCASQTPSNSGFNFGVGVSQNFVANVTDANAGQTLSFDWRLDGSTPGGAYFGITSGAATSTGTWTSTAGQVGTHNLAVNVSDSFDTVACSWPVEVLRNCAVSSASPTGASFRVANLGSTTTSFGVVANDPSCDITWKLNGTTISTAQNFQNILSSSLIASNTVEAVLANSVSTTTRSWAVTKNSPPACSQTPTPTGNSVDLGNTLLLSLTATDGDTDALTYAWTFNGGVISATSSGYNSFVNYTPTLGQVGNGQSIVASMTDGYDTATCSWNLDVIDPTSASIITWSPQTSPAMVLSNGSTDFSVTASGTGLTYEWKLDGVVMPANVYSLMTLGNAEVSVGAHTLTAKAIDTYGANDTHNFSVRRNAPPVIQSKSPDVSGITNYKIGYNQTYNFSVSATDANTAPTDTLTYDWTLDGLASGTLVGSGNSATFSAGGNIALIGTHTVRVTVSDGYEQITATWSINVNYFSDDCNTLYNSASTGPNGGKVCTLVGSPSMGDGEDVTTTPTKLKIKPWAMIEIQSGIYIVSDQTNHTVLVYNSNSSGDFTGFGKTVSPKTVKVVIGNGAAGRNSDASIQTPAFQSVETPAKSIPVFKLNNPYGLAYDSSTGVLYISDYTNNRVIALSSTGDAYRILGEAGGTASNNLATNVENAFGNTSSCRGPVGLAISGRYLYVACSTHAVIKRVNIDDPANATTYGKTTVAVGRVSDPATNIYVAPAAGLALVDGPAGADRTVTTGATAQAVLPWDMVSDGNGLIYWTERASASHGLRIRAYNPNATTIDFTPPTPTLKQNLTSAATSGLILRALDLNLPATALTAVDFTKANTRAFTASAGPITNLLVEAPSSVGQNYCHPISVTTQNAGAAPAAVGTPTTVTMSANFGATFYTDSDCLVSMGSNQFTLAANEVHQTVFVKATTLNIYTFTATITGATGNTGATVVSSAPAGTANKIAVFSGTKFKYDECLPVEIQIRTAANAVTTSGIVRYIAPDKNNIGSFYSDSSCSTMISRVAFGASDINKYVYYNRRTIIPQNWVGSILGYDTGASTTNAADFGNGIKIGQMKLTATPSGLDVLNGSGGAIPDAIIWGTDAGSVSYINLTATPVSYGGRSFNSFTSDFIFALPNPFPGTPTTITTGIFTGDDQPGFGAQLGVVGTVRFNLAKDSLLVVDSGNKRGRKLELNTAAWTKGLLGAGRDRYRTTVGTVEASNAALYQPYKIEHFNNNLYFSEYGNFWIRKVDLATGAVSPVVGNGVTGTTYQEFGPANIEPVRNPKGIKIVPYPNALTPTNYVLFYVEAANCTVRAVNLSATPLTGFFGLSGSIAQGQVRTVAGDSQYACTGWAASGNVDVGQQAIFAKFIGIEDLAFIDGSLYLTTSEHCLLKIDSSGILTRPQGTGTCGAVVPVSALDSTMDAMKTRFPRAFAADAGNPGNYFLVDGYSDNTGLIRYVNALTSLISFKISAPINVSARAAGASAPLVVKTIYNLQALANPASASYIGGIASWSYSAASHDNNDKVCWSAGQFGTPANGINAVYCANRYLDDNGTLVAGPDSSNGIRAGAPLGFEQEKIGRLNALFYTPYGLTFDADGNLYVTEYDNHIIRMVRRWW